MTYFAEILFQTCQDLEDERIEFMKDNMWTYANAVSTVCVSDDEVSVTTDVQMVRFTIAYDGIPSRAKRFELHLNSLNPRKIWKTL